MAFNYKRGDVYLVQESQTEGSEIRKTRPWVILGADGLNRARSTVIAIPLSTQVKDIPHLSIKIFLNGVTSCAVLDQIRALDKKRFIRHEGTLDSSELEAIEKGLRYILCL